MKKLSTVIISTLFLSTAFLLPMQATTSASELKGMILLQVEDNGEAWYVHPKTYTRKYLGRPMDAFNIMREFGLGITDENLNKIPIAKDYGDELATTINSEPSFVNKYLGYIFLQTEQNGEAWYVYPKNGHRYYLGRPNDAFTIMRKLGLGITNTDLEKIPKYSNKPLPSSVNLKMDFTSQAPYGIWEPPYDEACEEASFIMGANFFGKEQGISNASIANRQIVALTSYVEKLGYEIDLELEEAKKVYESYYDMPAKILREFDLESVKKELADGHPIVMPLAGREIGNPYFTPPGPIYHFLVIKGYTEDNKIITHDPGTKRGADYLYDFNVLYNANHEWNNGDVYNGKKGVIVLVKP